MDDELTTKSLKPIHSIGMSGTLGIIQLIFAILSYFHKGPSDQNVMLIWYMILLVPFGIMHKVAFSRIKSAVKNKTVSHIQGYFGLYLFLLSFLLLIILSLLYDYTDLY